jgi:hypothetical protein
MGDELKPKKRRKFKIILGIILLVLLISVITLFVIVNSSKQIEARLLVEQGNVEVNGRTAINEEILNEGDIVETFSGLATVILYESVVVNLDENTKITLKELVKEHPQLEQEYGTTWNKFTRLFGVEDYTIKSGNTLASVRGTSFEFSQNKVFTAEGKVDVTMGSKNIELLEGKIIEKVKDKVQERSANEEELMKQKLRQERVVKALQNLRELEMQKHQNTVNLIKKQLDISDEEIQIKLREADQGRYDIDKTLEQAPIKTAPVQKIAEITKTIQEANDKR